MAQQMTEAQALERLNTLVQTRGELKLIRPWLIPELRADATNLRSELADIDALYPALPATASEEARAMREQLRAEYDQIMKRPSSFLQADIAAITPHPSDATLVLAETDDGSHVMGTPSAVLARCRQWEHEG